MYDIINTVPLHLHCEIEYQHHTHETCYERNFIKQFLVKQQKCSCALFKVKTSTFKLTLIPEQSQNDK